MRSLILAALVAFSLPATAQSLMVSPDIQDFALAHVAKHGTTHGMSAADVADLVVSSAHTNQRTGVSYVYVQQRIREIDVAEAIVSVAINRNRRVVHAAGDLVSGTETAPSSPTLGADAAVSRAASLIGEPAPPTTNARRLAGASQKAVFGTIQTVPVSAKLLYVPTAQDGLRLAWQVILPSEDGRHVWQVRVDAQTGAELSRYDQVVSEAHAPHEPTPRASHQSFAPLAARQAPALSPFLQSASSGGLSSYTVYPFPVEAPLWTTPAPPADARAPVIDPNLDGGVASLFGWHDDDGIAGADHTITRGNNVYAYADTDNDNTPDLGGSPDGGASLEFDFPLDLTDDPSLYKDAAVTNLFYWNNVVHDILYQYGFDEAAGNFQTNNYGRGGVAFDDAVHAEAQDGAESLEPNAEFFFNCNAYFWTPADDGDDAGSGLGPRPRMQMYTCDLAAPDSDGDFDNAVIVHEYGHGLSNRLTGGSADITCLQNDEQMGEGWSDFYAVLLTMEPGQSRTTLRPIANHLFGQGTSGAGLRSAPYQPSPGAPYTTDFGVNSATYGATATAGQPGGLSRPHGLGFVWASILWEVTWDMIDQYGFDPDVYDANGGAGNQIMMNLVTEGLKLQPCSPGFVDGRDAILAADLATYGGDHTDILWKAFARRGLGLSASQGLTTLNTDNVEAFDAPLPVPVSSISQSSISVTLSVDATTTVPVNISNLAGIGAQDVNWSASLVFEEALKAPHLVPSVAASGPAASGSIEVVRTGPAVKTPPLRRAANTSASRGGSPTSGGPDAFGYTWTNSDDGGPGAPDLDFHYDVPLEGVEVSWTSASGFDPTDEGYADVGLPFSFPFYGTSYPFVRIYTNGFVTFSTFEGDSYNNTFLPDPSDPSNMIAPLWADMDMSYGAVYVDELGDGRFVIHYENAQFFGDDPNTNGTSLNFEILLSPNGTIEYQYDFLDGSNLDNATIGIENEFGDDGLLVSAFNPYFLDGGFHAIRFEPGQSAWASVAPGAGSVTAGGQQTMSVTFDTAGLDEGTYTADLVLTTNDPLQPSVTIPLTMTRRGSNILSGAEGWRLLSPAASGMTVGDFAAMNLVQGLSDLYPGAAPNLYTTFDGSVYTPASATTEVISPGQGFWWYLFDQDITPGGASNSFELPIALLSPKPVVTTDADVTLTVGAGPEGAFNMLGNPFGVSLAVGSSWVDSEWPGSVNLASNVVQIWDPIGPGTGSYVTSATRPVISAWQGFFAEVATAGTLTITENSRTTGGGLTKTAPTDPMIAFELAEADGTNSDLAAVLTFTEGASADRDRGDASKLESAAAQYVLLAFATGDDGGMRAVENRPVEALSVPMSVASVGASSDLVLTWPRVEHLPEGWSATIRDLETGGSVDLLAETKYEFRVVPSAARAPSFAPAGAKASWIPARFKLEVGPQSVATEGDASNALALEAPRPNPVTGQTRLGFELAQAGPVRISVIDIQGREVAVVLDEDRQVGAGFAILDASALASGVYVVRMDADGQMLTRRLVVTR